ncbi:uncharacterized protein LOC142240139 [Haematobia irritans]|uniref:uncharacterized protein LOC142240139 n=1 Tax=Haematobia irritans TaxID=7368 RepID=UPI003F508599
MIESHTNKQHLTEREKYYLRTVEHTRHFLKHNKNIIILEADKGNVTVGMEKLEYDTRMEKIVNDIMMYRKLKSDPTNKLQRINNELVDELFKHNIIDDSEKRRMKTEAAIAPRIYGLPKIHKQDYPLRPICSSINSPSSNLCKHLTTILNRLTENSKYNVKNSMQFKSKIEDIKIDEDETMVSFDVVSLFPSIPVELALKIIEEKWHLLEKITKIPKNLFFKILRFCIIDNRYFRYKTSFYQQRKGLPMGSSASPIVADIVMEELLDRCMANCDIRPKILTNIKFTLEYEKCRQIPYLDILIIRDGNKIKTDWYQKPTSSGRLCNGNEKDVCDKVYVGTTKNKLKTRLSGHKSDLKHRLQRPMQKTALSTHCAGEHHHPDLERARVLQCESNYNKRLTLEMLHILNTPTQKRINYKTDTDNLAQSYRNLIRKSKAQQSKR